MHHDREVGGVVSYHDMGWIPSYQDVDTRRHLQVRAPPLGLWSPGLVGWQGWKTGSHHAIELEESAHNSTYSNPCVPQLEFRRKLAGPSLTKLE